MIYDAIDYGEGMKELTGLPFRGITEVAKGIESEGLRRRVGRRLASLKKVSGEISSSVMRGRIINICLKEEMKKS